MFLLITGGLWGQEEPEKRGMSLCLGLGWAPLISYPSGPDATVKQLRALAGVTETDITLNLDLAFYLGKTQFEGRERATYYSLSVGIDGYATRLEDWSGSLQINNYVYGIGVQTQTGNWISRVLVGPAVAVAQLTAGEIEVTAKSDWGYGVSTQIGWDFNPTGGFGVLLGANSSFSFIQSKHYGQAGLFAALTYL